MRKTKDIDPKQLKLQLENKKSFKIKMTEVDMTRINKNTIPAEIKLKKIKISELKRINKEMDESYNKYMSLDNDLLRMVKDHVDVAFNKNDKEYLTFLFENLPNRAIRTRSYVFVWLDKLQRGVGVKKNG